MKGLLYNDTTMLLVASARPGCRTNASVPASESSNVAVADQPILPAMSATVSTIYLGSLQLFINLFHLISSTETVALAQYSQCTTGCQTPNNFCPSGPAIAISSPRWLAQYSGHFFLAHASLTRSLAPPWSIRRSLDLGEDPLSQTEYLRCTKSQSAKSVCHVELTKGYCPEKVDCVFKTMASARGSV
jgi:hypothetical protein